MTDTIAATPTRSANGATASFEDVRYEIDGPVAVITINRPHRYNAFRGRTVEELIMAFRLAWADKSVQAVILTGAVSYTHLTLPTKA